MMPQSRAARLSDGEKKATLFAPLDTELELGEPPLRRLVRRELLIVRPDATIRDTLFSLNQADVQAGVVAENPDAPLGIVTLHDLVEAITLKKAALTDPTFTFMTAAPVTLPVDAPVHRARVTMTRGRLRHLVLLESDGRLFNLLLPEDLPGFREGGAEGLVERINLADNIDSMADAAQAVRARAHELFVNGMGIEALCKWMSGLNDLINIRVIELVADEFDLPPVSWCWVVFGSEGRLEQAFASDQDNGLIFLPENESDTDAVRNALLPFTQAVNRALDICGFMLCPGDIMAGNPVWCLSVQEWRKRFSTWMEEPDPEALLNASIFFDFRPLYGQDDLVDELHQWLLPQPSRWPRFLRGMAEQALGCKPSLGWFGNFSYDSRHRHPHTIDLKTRGSRPFVDSARIWALQHGVWTSNTVERLRAVGLAMRRSNADTAASVEAFDFIQRLRIQRQLAGGDYDEINRVNPSELTTPQRMMLKEAFKQAKLLQLRLSQEFLQQ
jgi:CBS domain-containing protein